MSVCSRLTFRALMLVVPAALTLSACGTTDRPAAPPSSLASSGAPLPVAGYDWHLNEDSDEASLSYGMAESDDVPLDLSCRTGSRELVLLYNTEKGAPSRIVLESGGEIATYRASAEPSPMGDGLDLTATVPASDPVFKRFRQLGWLALNPQAERRALVATEASVPQVKRFFEICDPSR